MSRNYSSSAAEAALAAPINDSQTSIVVSATTGFPAVPYVLAIDPEVVTQELVLVTGVAGTTLTVTRGYDSTSAVSHLAGAVIQHSHAAIDFRESRAHEGAENGVHGVTGDVVGTTDTQTLTNKDLSAGTNTFPGSLATSAALTAHESDTSTHGVSGAVVGTTDSQTLTNKTLALGSNTVSGTKAQFNTAMTDADFASLAGSETLTNKTVALGSNTVSGTKAQFDTACTDADFASLAGTETLTNKTLSTGTLVGAATTDISAAWAAWTPVQSGFTLGNGTLAGTYVQIGKTVHFYMKLTIGSTTSFSSSWSFTVPVAGVAGKRFSALIDVVDISAAQSVTCRGVILGSTLFPSAPPTTAGGYDRPLVSTVPVPWATGDTLEITGTYEAA